MTDEDLDIIMPTAKLHESYKIQDGCHNCRYLHNRNDPESFDAQCNYTEDCPPDHYDGPVEEWEKISHVFYEWMRGRDVREQGICDHWEKS